jgi:hypothetical protein
MSEKQPVKRGILSSLMGLFGEDEAEEDSPQPRPENGSRGQAPQVAGEPDSPVKAPYPDSHVTEVVREAYEPGWYNYSRQGGARRGPTADGYSEAEDDAVEEAEADELVGSMFAPGTAPTIDPPRALPHIDPYVPDQMSDWAPEPEA